MSQRTFDQIVTRVRTICVDLDVDLEDEIPVAIERAQEDAEDFWEYWPFLNSQIYIPLVDAQVAYTTVAGSFNSDAVGAGQFRTFMRWRLESPPYRVPILTAPELFEGAAEPMEWSIAGANAEFNVTDKPNVFQGRGDDRAWGPSRAIYPIINADTPQVVVPIDNDGVQVLLADDQEDHRPLGVNVFPVLNKPTDANFFRWHVVLPFQARQPKLESGVTNYFTNFLARYLENAAASTLLADNQDGRFAAYRAMSDSDILRHKNMIKRRTVRHGYLEPRTDKNGLRTQARLYYRAGGRSI